MAKELTGFEYDDLTDYNKDELVQIAKKYSIYYKTDKGVGSMANYNRLTKHQLVSLIRNDRDYINTKNKKEYRDYVVLEIENKIAADRFYELRARLKGNEKPEELMDEILTLAEGTEVDQVLP